MILTIAALRLRMEKEARERRGALVSEYVKRYKGLPPASELNAIDAQLQRIVRPLPRGEFCPSCYFRDGIKESQMTDLDSGTESYIRMICGRCGFEDLRPR